MESVMGEKTDQAKGRVKEAAGALTGDKDLESEGKADRVAGEIKEKVGDVKDKAEDLVDKAKDVLHHK
jgi:uncharacterized protein YjbJ (UPF0337 family)